MNKEEIKNNLLPFTEKLNGLKERLVSEKAYLSNDCDTVYSLFSDQPEGRALISELQQAQKQIQMSFNELDQLNADVLQYCNIVIRY